MCTDSDPNKGALLSSSLKASAPCNKGFLTWQPVCSQTQSEFRNLQFINIMTQFCYNVEVSGGEISSWFGWYNLKGFACYMGATKSYTDTPKAQCRYMKTVSPCPVVPNKQDTQPTGAQAVAQNVRRQWKNYSTSNQKRQPWSQRICHFLLTACSVMWQYHRRQLWLIAHPRLRTIRRGLECHALVESNNNLYPLWGAAEIKNMLSDWPLG